MNSLAEWKAFAPQSNVSSPLEQTDIYNSTPKKEEEETNTTSRPVLRSLDESFLACLLVMDENFRLSEWLNYHYYHVLPLRYLVVAVDRNSRLLPEPIFDQFRQELNMTIISWKDSAFLGRRHRQNTNARHAHLARQKVFLGKCLEHMVHHNCTWTAL
jgi:hypothetical protein